eukprot:TRINITY_DN4680_c3_g1_i1.p1 TRINITY_DN4680_c3_g1~~TRINITY_DN4680_c3_g1_i1.p1  ORF type:complete len:175 (+),score=37.25 TRINITY_DN4680_c3_g1_i1:87-611(+)
MSSLSSSGSIPLLSDTTALDVEMPSSSRSIRIALDDDEFVSHDLPPASPSHNLVHLHITGMTCASCVSIIESVVGGIDGVSVVSVNLLMEKGRVEYDHSLLSAEDVAAAIEDVGFSATILSVEDRSAGVGVSTVQDTTHAGQDGMAVVKLRDERREWKEGRRDGRRDGRRRNLD